MSNPPSGFPMPGGPYYPAPQRPANNNAGCFKAVGITCGVLFVIVAIVLIFFVRYVKNQMSNPGNNPIGIGIKAGLATQGGMRLQQAIVAYHTKHGQYPKNLMQLVMDGETDGRELHNGLDPNPNPAHISWQYTRPAEGAPGDTPILREPYQITFGNQSTQGQIVINLNGSSGSSSNSP